MTPYYADSWLTVYHGDCRAVMAEMEPESVHCVVTSPPYWGLRDYGDPGQLGLEPTPEEYVANLVAVFREVRRVLRKDGTVWLNLGDSYASHDPGGWREGEFLNPDGREPVKGQARNRAGNYRPGGLKPKDLVGIPWRVAFALQADGWYLRSDIIWSKPNPMPESVTDRPTKSHEYLFLLAKSARYYFDADAVREGALYTDHNARYGEAAPVKVNAERGDLGAGRFVPSGAGRNIRSVWTVATAPYPGSHFATFPPKLIEPCIKAGTSERGVCPECGAPWERVVERDAHGFSLSQARPVPRNTPVGGLQSRRITNTAEFGRAGSADLSPRVVQTTGWRPTCGRDCGSWHLDGEWQRTSPQPDPIPATILDPFAGSGTTGLVAQSLSRRAVLIDLSLDYLGQLMDRNADIPLGLGA